MNVMNVMNGDIEFSQYSSLLHNQNSLIFKKFCRKILTKPLILLTLQTGLKLKKKLMKTETLEEKN